MTDEPLSLIKAWTAVEPFLLPIATFVAGIGVKAAIDQYARKRVDTSLELLRTDLRRNEEAFKAEIKRSDDQLNAVRAAALSGMNAKRELISKKQIEAAEALWHGVNALYRYKSALHLVQVMNVDLILEKASAKDDEALKLQKFGADLLKTTGAIEKQQPFMFAHHRIYVSDITWANFDLYYNILARSVGILTLLSAGLNKDTLVSPKPLVDALKAALPAHALFIEGKGEDAFPYVIEYLQSLVLQNIKDDIARPSDRVSHVEQASEIMKMVALYSDDNAKKSATIQRGLVDPR